MDAVNESPGQTVDTTVDTPWTRLTVDTSGGVISPGSPRGDVTDVYTRGDPAEYITAVLAGGANVDAVLDRIRRARPAWHDEAACQGTETALYFPARGQSTTTARAICARCPVIDECLQDALATPEADDYGVRGATSANERRAMRRQEER